MLFDLGRNENRVAASLVGKWAYDTGASYDLLDYRGGAIAT
jgi:hypothetical protein